MQNNNIKIEKPKFKKEKPKQFKKKRKRIKGKKRNSNKSIQDKYEIIYINGKPIKIEKVLDEKDYVIKKQIIDFNYYIKKTPKLPCKTCQHNQNGYCSYYHQWCSNCYQNCIHKGTPKVCEFDALNN